MRRQLIFIYLIVGIGVVTGSRVRRHLVFSENSRLFFSVDLRDNLFDYYKLFAQVFGVKIDWDLPSSVVSDPNKSRLQRRDLYQGLEHVLNRQNLNGTSCVQKFTCEATKVLSKYNIFFAQLYEVIFSYNDKDDENIDNSCEKKLSSMDCPLSLLSFIPLPESQYNLVMK